MTPRIGYIYRITSLIDGRVYIGSTLRPRDRFARHLRNLRRGDHHSAALQRAWNKYGEASFTFEMVETVTDHLFLLAREQAWINRERATEQDFGFNMHPTAGSSLGYKHTSSFGEAISSRLKGKPRPAHISALVSESKRGNTYTLGKKWPQETIEKMRASAKARGITPENREKMNAARRAKIAERKGAL